MMDLGSLLWDHGVRTSSSYGSVNLQPLIQEVLVLLEAIPSPQDAMVTPFCDKPPAPERYVCAPAQQRAGEHLTFPTSVFNVFFLGLHVEYSLVI